MYICTLYSHRHRHRLIQILCYCIWIKRNRSIRHSASAAINLLFSIVFILGLYFSHSIYMIRFIVLKFRCLQWIMHVYARNFLWNLNNLKKLSHQINADCLLFRLSLMWWFYRSIENPWNVANSINKVGRIKVTNWIETYWFLKEWLNIHGLPLDRTWTSIKH